MNNNSFESTTPIYTLGVISGLSGIPVHSIRQYIDKGLIIPFRKESNRNLFSQTDLSRLRFIRKLLFDNGLNVAGIKALLAVIPCWKVRKCKPEEREKCQAFSSSTFPCWEASEKGTLCRNTNCRECEVYQIVENYPDIKTYIKTIVE